MRIDLYPEQDDIVKRLIAKHENLFRQIQSAYSKTKKKFINTTEMKVGNHNFILFYFIF